MAVYRVYVEKSPEYAVEAQGLLKEIRHILLIKSVTGVRVLNRGFNAAKNRWQEAEGRAYFVLDPNTAYLKVSFFGPFYGAYIVTELDPDYRHVLVSGPNHDYLWILARTPQLEATVRDRLVARAKALGFATDELIWVEH